MNGLGAILSKTRKAALEFSAKIAASNLFDEFLKPELDIVTYFPRTEPLSASLISNRTQKLFSDAMHHPEHPLFLALLQVPSKQLKSHYLTIESDRVLTTILRSVLMKPEHLLFVPEMVRELEEMAG
jgi:hypothetical protein